MESFEESDVTTSWGTFFDAQRQAVEGIALPADGSKFQEVCEVLAAPLAVSAVTWMRAGDTSLHQREYTWSSAGRQPAKTVDYVVDVTCGSATHAFSITTDASAGLPAAMLIGIAQTIVMVCEQASAVQAALSEAANSGEVLGHGVTDFEGNILDTDADFENYIRRQEPDWDGRRLPMPLRTDDAAQREGLTWMGLFFYVDVGTHAVHLRVRPDHRLPDVSPRELEVARCIAAGMTFKEVARELRMAPSTASTHLYKVYDKLGINRRSALVDWLREYAE